MTHDLWATLNEKMYDYLASVKLSDLVETHKRNSEAAAQGETVDVSALHDKRRPTVLTT